MQSASVHNLRSFLEASHRRIDAAIDAQSFEAGQGDLLVAVLDVYRARTLPNPTSDPVAPIYQIARAWGRPLAEQAELLAAFCTLYIVALDLFDDVQDDDLAGKPLESAGSALAINTALTALFLGLDLLRQAIAREPNPACQPAYWEIFNATGGWAGAEPDAVFRHTSSTWERLPLPAGRPLLRPGPIAFGPDGSLWVGGVSALVRYPPR